MKIGQEVLVKGIAKRVWAGNMEGPPLVEWKNEEIEYRIGYYVGYTHKFNGWQHPDKQAYDGEYIPGYLKVRESVKLLRIKFSQRHNDVFCFEDQILVIP